MAFRRRRVATKKRVTRRPAARTGGFARRVRKVVQRMVEPKQVSLVAPLVNPATTVPQFYYLNDVVSQGTGGSQRIGNQLKMRSLRFRYSWFLPVGLGTGHCLARVIVGYSHINPSQFSTVLTPPDVYTPWNHNVNPKSWILYDKTSRVADSSAGSTAAGDIPIVTFTKVNRFLRGATSKYNGSAANAMIDGFLWIYVISSVAGLAAPTITYNYNFEFVDA